MLARGGKHGLRLGQAQRQRLLAQDVLAMRRRLDSPLGMQAVGQGDVDGVNGRVGQQRLIAAVVARNAVGCGIGGSGVGVAAGHGIDPRAFAGPHVARELFGDVGAAEDADAQGRGGVGVGVLRVFIGKGYAEAAVWHVGFGALLAGRGDLLGGEVGVDAVTDRANTAG